MATVESGWNTEGPPAPTVEAAEPAALAEMPAAEALQRLRAGEPVAGVRIVGLRLRGEFTSAVEFRNATLVDLRVDKAVFREDVQFAGCTLVKARLSKGSVFEKNLDLRGSTLKRAALHNVVVQGELRLDNACTHGSLRLERCRLADCVRVWDARFHGWVEFKDCEFGGLADFRSFNADEGLLLERCRFAGDALFRGATVCKKLDFSGSQLDGLLDLSKAKLHDFVYLEGIVQGPEQRFAFANAVGDRILVGRGQLAGRMQSERRRDFAAAMQEFGFLKRNFQALHRFEDEDWALYRFKINQRRAKPRSWLRPWSKLAQLCDLVFLDFGCGYGTNPFRAVVSAVSLMLLFALVYMAGIHQFDVVHAPLADQPIDSPANRFLYGVVKSVSVFTSGFTGDHLNGAKGWMMVPLAAEALLGTLLWGLFIVAFSRKVIR